MLDILLSWLNNYLASTYLYTYENIQFEENNMNKFKNAQDLTLNDNNNSKQKNTIKQENKNIEDDIRSIDNVTNIENNSAQTENNIFQNVAKKLKDEKKFKPLCIECISEYIIDTIYETDETFYLVKEKLENLNNDYSYELIFSTISNKREELLLFKFTSKQKFLSEQDYINSLFEIFTKNIQNI